MPSKAVRTSNKTQTVQFKELTGQVDVPNHYIARYNYFVNCNLNTTEHPSKWRPFYLPVMSVFDDYGKSYHTSLKWRIYWLFERLSILYQLGFVGYRWYFWEVRQDTANHYSLLAFGLDLLMCLNLQTWMVLTVLYNHLFKHRMTSTFVPAAQYERVSKVAATNGVLEVSWERFVELGGACKDQEKQSLLGTGAKTSGKVSVMVYTRQWWTDNYSKPIQRLVLVWMWYLVVLFAGVLYYYHKTGNLIN